MKVAFATHQATAVVRGGPRTQMLQTAAELRALGVEVRMLDSWTQLQPNDVDMVHIFGAGMGTFHFARALRQQGIPFVVSPIYLTRRSPAVVRSVIVAERLVGKMFRGLWSDYGMIDAMCGWARCVIPNTEIEATVFRNAFRIGQERLFVVPNGVEERFRTASPDMFVEKFGVKDFILNVGHIGPVRKNVAMLVQALESIDHSAVIIGRIEDSAEARAIVSKASRNLRLRIVDHLDHESPLLASAYAACSVFALPSHFETPGIAALEAGLAGARVVITPNGGTREYFGPLAEYVDPYSVEDIRRGIAAALEKPRTTELANHIASKFLWKHSAQRMLEVYMQALTL